MNTCVYASINEHEQESDGNEWEMSPRIAVVDGVRHVSLSP